MGYVLLKFLLDEHLVIFKYVAHYLMWLDEHVYLAAVSSIVAG